MINNCYSLWHQITSHRNNSLVNDVIKFLSFFSLRCPDAKLILVFVINFDLLFQFRAEHCLYFGVEITFEDSWTSQPW